MPIPLGPIGNWGFVRLDDWERGPVPDQAPF